MVLAIGGASIVLASLAAFVHDDIEHVVGYSIIGDAGVIILAVAVLDPAAWEPARTFILAFVIARSAFAAWAAATRATFSTGRVDDLGGGCFDHPRSASRSSPSSWPASACRGSRSSRHERRSWASPSMDRSRPSSCWARCSPLAYYGRLLAVGLSRPASGRGRIVAGTRITVTPFDVTGARAWFITTWGANRAFTATAGSSSSP